VKTRFFLFFLGRSGGGGEERRVALAVVGDRFRMARGR
jgi:hypothetical protein